MTPSKVGSGLENSLLSERTRTRMGITMLTVLEPSLSQKKVDLQETNTKRGENHHLLGHREPEGLCHVDSNGKDYHLASDIKGCNRLPSGELFGNVSHCFSPPCQRSLTKPEHCVSIKIHGLSRSHRSEVTMMDTKVKRVVTPRHK